MKSFIYLILYIYIYVVIKPRITWHMKEHEKKTQQHQNKQLLISQGRSFILYLFIYLFRLRRIFSCGMRTLSCGMNVGSTSPTPGIKPRPPASGAWRLPHWTTREVPGEIVYNSFKLWVTKWEAGGLGGDKLGVWD